LLESINAVRPQGDSAVHVNRPAERDTNTRDVGGGELVASEELIDQSANRIDSDVRGCAHVNGAFGVKDSGICPGKDDSQAPATDLHPDDWRSIAGFASTAGLGHLITSTAMLAANQRP
jgi:hypothetical protein